MVTVIGTRVSPILPSPSCPMSLSPIEIDSDILLSVVEHVFLPPKLPQKAPEKDAKRASNIALCHTLMQAATMFRRYLSPSQKPVWDRITKMMGFIDRAASAPLAEADLERELSTFSDGDVFVMHVRAQNAAVLLRVFIDHVRFEIFEVSPQTTKVMSTNRKLLCSYPGPAVQVSSEVFADPYFLPELSSFLIQMDIDVLDSAATTSKAGSTVREVRESADPRYISQLLVGILRGIGEPASVDRITKRIADEVLWKGAYKPWRRSPLWLVIRVALQTSLDHGMYKTFILFFHTHLLQICIERGFPSETLHLMRIKMSRRLSKLGSTVSDDVFQAVSDTAKKTEELLRKRWARFQDSQSTSPPWDRDGLDFDSDTAITLNNSRQYLMNALLPTSRNHPPTKFSLSHQPRFADTLDFRHFSKGRLAEAITKDNRIALADFELSVERHLDSWVASCQQGDDPLDVIASCVDQYFSSARKIYGSDPEENSVMILTILDLWKALDTMAIRRCHLLKSYSPEIPRDFLHPLLLHRSGSLRRAKLIEDYILLRHVEASNATSIFSDGATELSFALQYYRDSLELQQIYTNINERASKEREEKRKELTILTEKRKELKAEASKMKHGDHHWRWKKFCEKCRVNGKADRLAIRVHEWPLPRDTLRAQSVIFELSPPRAFSTWREITYQVLFDIGMPSAADQAEPKLLLDAYSGLKYWAVKHKYHRITIASTTKSFSDQTHYKSVRIPAKESNVLVNNGLSFKLYDRTGNSWAAQSFLGSTITSSCTPPIPASSPYGKIHSFVSETHHTSNGVIAAQADCPPELSLHEYLAFAGLRSGPRLQWLNIARELSSPSLSFRREEVHTLITQAAWQIGPLSDGVREWHLDLEIPSFGMTLLKELEALIGRIEANWLEGVTVRTIVLLTSRLLSSSQDPHICQTAYKLLRTARTVTYKWIGELGSKLENIDKLDKTADEVSRASLGRRLCILAATCFSTYDVCPKHVPQTLSSDLDFTIAMHCAVIVHDNTPSNVKDDSGFLVRLLNRHCRLLHHLEPFFRQGAQSNPTGFHNGVTRLWPEFRRQSRLNWRILPGSNSRWISCTVGGGREVHYNLLAGKLLIGGKPLGRLPRKFVKHRTYASILGARILDVVPADIRVPEMEFMTRSNVSGYQLYFSLRDGDLTVKALGSGDSTLLQLVPREVFVEDFPRAFVDDYIHWLDLGTGEVEFRPVDSLWTPDPSNWRLLVHKDNTCSIFRRSSGPNAVPIVLIDVRSDTFRMISRILSALDSPEHIIITRTNQALEATLTRLHLSFFVNTGSELECRSMPGYVIDKCQRSGTMFGLENQLVLCPSNGSSEMSRRVIIPHGKIVFGLEGDFAKVSISTESAQNVYWHEYTIDNDLGRLTGNVGLRSRLYQCYLHALTSHCLPDPLLGHTGTEESLNMLRSAAFLSFQRLDNDDARLLHLIAELTPSREYYPPHLQSMVTVEWNDLPVLSQHHDFHPAVISILDHAHAMEALTDNPVVFEVPPRQVTLLSRAAFRNRVYYPHDLQSSRYSPSSIPEDDIAHMSRDLADGESAEHVAYQTSWSVWNAKAYLPLKWLNLWDEIESWESIGPSQKQISLRYSRNWLTFDAAKDWISIYDICQEALSRNPQESKFKLAFSLSAASFSSSDRAEIVPLVLIFATDRSFFCLTPPPEPHFELSDGTSPDSARLESLIQQFCRPFEEIPAQTLNVRATGSESDSEEAESERREEYSRIIDHETREAARSIEAHWRTRHYDLPHQWFEAQRCREKIEEYLQSISRNIDLRAHIHRLQPILNSYETGIPSEKPYVFSPKFNARPHKSSSPSLREVLMSRTRFRRQPTPKGSSSGFASPSTATITTKSNPAPAIGDGLSSLIQELRHSRESFLRFYGENLNKSYDDLLGKGASILGKGSVPPQDELLKYRDSCSKTKDAIFFGISDALEPSQKLERVIGVSGLWPRITPRSILRQLRVRTLTDPWKDAITLYAVAFLKYQQSQRLIELCFRHQSEEFLREAETTCEDIAAYCSPDWLLIQIDANFLARPLQLAIAREMISPTCQRSASFQLNMGEGKSSVIVPLVAATLADGSKLSRVVTLKPLSNQMFQLLLGRLSGLADRRIFYIPFSRNLRMNASVVQSISALYRQCIDECGVLVVQPEHLLSQKLMCIDTLLTPQGKLSAASQLGDLQRWLAEVSRDVLDESDEILHVRYQLVYTAGEQMPVEDHPNRWSTTQQVFGLLRKHAAQWHADFPKMFELDQAQKGFPTMRILGRDVSRRISSLITEEALGGALSTLSLTVLSSSIREATRLFLTQKEVSVEVRELIYSRCTGTTLWSGILLLRGLLVEGEGILGYVLKERRWRVDYGLDPSRTLLAVPYRAKDVPSLRAEFGHPDVAIALTCLSYYYGGLTKEQVLQCFDLLAKLDNPIMEYDLWVESGKKMDIPDSLRQINGVNTDDDTQVDEHLVPLFSRNTRVIDFYLSQVVFPRAAKEFPNKLSTSAWDLVEDKSNVTTGFSGTNDNRYLLPTSITQEDPLSQLSTNALVLQYLLQPENNHYECTEGINGERESAEGFLRRLVRHTPEIRVLLDVGAQMLELQNEDLARHWLSLKPHISAAIFFNESDHLTVLTRDGTIEPFTSSPFNRQLDKCVVYLDDAHTRGTDLKLPRETRAAVTLGPKVTKDRLLQGCMRMRQLGKGQSVMFFAPGEVDRRIRDLIPTGQTSEDCIHVIDILRWAMHETCEDITHNLPHWAQQGLDHSKRFSADKEYRSSGDLAILKGAWLQPESRTLEEMYDPGKKVEGTGFREINEVSSLRERLELLGVTQLTDVRMAEEQEREVNHEIEREPQVERPPKLEPATHTIHNDIHSFIITGDIPHYSEYIIPLLAPTGIDKALESTTDWSPCPRATADFAFTTRDRGAKPLTEYLRPVNWVVSSGFGKDSVAIVISPYEANELLPYIRKSNTVRLHIYAARVTASMRSFSDLTFHTIPESPTIAWTSPAHMRMELNLFAGQLYFDSKEEYERVCVLFALSMAHPGAKEIEVDGFVHPSYRTGESSPLDSSVIATFKKLTGLRRKGMGYDKTHLGRVLDARPLGESEIISLVQPETENES
ncbi:hypothetical protein EI94DRAFT_1747586 [Lactarius quietus]|nr:hypothetical protein EI94DRAFT_1747586 [Lactarius quietus]